MVKKFYTIKKNNSFVIIYFYIIQIYFSHNFDILNKFTVVLRTIYNI